ncbi:MAG TPA: hypothetical protein VKX46_20735 [Ktedonobacteraceae bacterium]|nr:hypothetical protein [Ktedonobacteraceae bacterium]
MFIALGLIALGVVGLLGAILIGRGGDTPQHVPDKETKSRVVTEQHEEKALPIEAPKMIEPQIEAYSTVVQREFPVSNSGFTSGQISELQLRLESLSRQVQEFEQRLSTLSTKVE